uniref:Neprosin domain-containing protein n=1 Tax=Aegilops tauschii subsp. strangulata TaxID=200361 RepID=A0A453J382_AEGTS
MFRLTLLRRAVVLCLFFHAVQIRGIRLSSTIHEEPTSLARALAYGPVKQNLTYLKSNSIETTTSGQDSSSWDQTYFAVHQTSSGGPTDNYYGLHATMGVYGHKLKPGQLTSTYITVTHSGDGVKSSFNAIQVGWHVSIFFRSKSSVQTYGWVLVVNYHK